MYIHNIKINENHKEKSMGIKIVMQNKCNNDINIQHYDILFFFNLFKSKESVFR